MRYAPDGVVPPLSSAFGKFESPGLYQTDVARPALFSDYLEEQLNLLDERYDVSFSVGPSQTDIPYPFVLEGASSVDADRTPPSALARLFPTPNLAVIDDAIANGDRTAMAVMNALPPSAGPRPLALFGALRTDYSLQRLRHYTGTAPGDFQQYILFTNYHRYMDEFVDLACERLRASGDYTELVAPGGTRVRGTDPDDPERVKLSPWRRHQMPAYHLTAPGGQGITLVNIGVGPSNAKTITDHLAVLRPQCWIMIGHCGGLRHSQRLGDYVLAHAYLRRDHVLDRDLPPDIPVPPIAEIQLALTAATGEVSEDVGDRKTLKGRLRTGTVVTHDDRNWELRFAHEAQTLGQARAIAIDMESATVAANGYRFRVPYGTLLCVSDKPLHGEIKLPGAANSFYERAIGEHMRIGMRALEILRRDDAAMLHSRKLRSFDEPPFR